MTRSDHTPAVLAVAATAVAGTGMLAAVDSPAALLQTGGVTLLATSGLMAIAVATAHAVTAGHGTHASRRPQEHAEPAATEATADPPAPSMAARPPTTALADIRVPVPDSVPSVETSLADTHEFAAAVDKRWPDPAGPPVDDEDDGPRAAGQPWPPPTATYETFHAWWRPPAGTTDHDDLYAHITTIGSPTT